MPGAGDTIVSELDVVPAVMAFIVYLGRQIKNYNMIGFNAMEA